MNQRDPIDRELYHHQLPHHQDQPSNLPLTIRSMADDDTGGGGGDRISQDVLLTFDDDDDDDELLQALLDVAGDGEIEHDDEIELDVLPPRPEATHGGASDVDDSTSATCTTSRSSMLATSEATLAPIARGTGSRSPTRSTPHAILSTRSAAAAASIAAASATVTRPTESTSTPSAINAVDHVESFSGLKIE